MASLGFRFKHFVKRHERWFTFAGAFIVFMTFVIKEQLGERWRGISDTLDNARHMYELQKGSSETQAQIDALLHIIQTRKALAESVPEDIPEGAPRLSYDEPTYFTWYHDSLIEVQDTLHNVSIVTDKMPHGDPETPKLLALQGELPKATEELSELEQFQMVVNLNEDAQEQTGKEGKVNIFDLLAKDLPWTYRAPDNPYLKQGAYHGKNPYAGRLLAFEYSVRLLEMDADSLARTTFAHAEEIRQANEIKSGYAHWISTGLFALGWGLGLLGKIYGVSAGGGE